MVIKIIITVVIILITLFILWLINIYNLFQYNLIKINKADKNLYTVLHKKHSTLNRFLNIIKEYVKVDDDNFKSYLKINTLNNSELDKKLIEYNTNIQYYLDLNEKIIKKDNVKNVIKDLKEVEASINGCKNYYNKSVTLYNRLVHCFPSIIIAKIYHYKEKEYYQEEVNEHFKIIDNDN